MLRSLIMAQFVTATWLMIFASPRAAAQCGDWRARMGFYLRGAVFASVSWDPDGAGPQPPLLVVGGNFERAGAPTGIPARNVAAWDGESWQAFGAGMNHSVFALAVYNSQLFAGGIFTSADGQLVNHVARWNAAAGAWEALSGGITGSSFTSVYALAVYNNELIAGGVFDHAGTQPAFDIARWNGSGWQPVGGPIGGYVYSLATYGSDLIAAGRFISAGGMSAMNIARWNPSIGWRAVGGGIWNRIASSTDLLPVEGAAWVGTRQLFGTGAIRSRIWARSWPAHRRSGPATASRGWQPAATPSASRLGRFWRTCRSSDFSANC